MTTHTDFTRGLRGAMMREYDAVHRRRNPVAAALVSIDTASLAYVLAQYTPFPRAITTFLGNVRDTARAQGAHEIADEMEENIGEERGSGTEGVPHYDILIGGIARKASEYLTLGAMLELSYVPLRAVGQYSLQQRGWDPAIASAATQGALVCFYTGVLPPLKYGLEQLFGGRGEDTK